MRQLAMLGCALLLAACSGPSEAERKAQEEDNLVIIGKDQIRALLRDPESAVFTSVRVAHTAGVPAVCGYVNSKNGLGGMTGSQRFIAGGKAALEEQFAPGEFEGAWGRLC